MEIITVILISLCMYAVYKLSSCDKECNEIKKDGETVWFTCLKCGTGMSCISDIYNKNGNNHVIYECPSCGYKSDYNFDVTSASTYWEELNGDKS